MVVPAIIFLWFVLLALPALAVDRFFQTSGGSDSNNCQSGSPCTSMQRFDDFTPSCGDRFFFRCGDTFADTSGNGVDWTQIQCSSATKIEISSFGSCTGSNRPIWDKNSDSGYGIILKSVDWVDISNLEIRDYAFSMELRGSRNVTVRSVKAHNPNFTCYRVGDDPANNDRFSDNLLFDLVEASSCGIAGNGEGFYVGDNPSSGASRNITLQDSYIHDTWFECLEVKQGTDPSITLVRNTLANCHRDNHATGSPPGGDSGTGFVATGAGSNNSQVTIRQNWVFGVLGTEDNHSGVGIRWQNQGAEISYNVFETNQGEGYRFAGSGGNNHPRNLHHNTFFDNGRECGSTTGSNHTITDNICWENASGNDASDPLFVNAAANNFNITATSPAYLAGAGSTSRGALQSFAWTSASILSDGVTVRVTGAINSLFQPLSSGTASAFSLNCSIAGVQAGTTFTPSGLTDALVTVAVPVTDGETCTLSATAAAASDSANIGGALAPGGSLKSTSLTLTNLSVTNGSTQGGEGGGTAPNLLTVQNLLTDCTNCNPGAGCAKLLDLDLNLSEGSDPGLLAANQTSAVCEHDLGASFPLDKIEAWCDDTGSLSTLNLTVATKVNLGDSYVTAINQGTCNARKWHTFSLIGTTARYMQMTFGCPAGGCQAIEYRAFEDPQTLPPEGVREVIRRSGFLGKSGTRLR